MYCKKCGQTLNDDAQFCAKCGQPTEATQIIQEPPTTDVPSQEQLPHKQPIGLMILGFLIPFVGIIIALVKLLARNNPATQNAGKKIMLASIAGMVIFIIWISASSDTKNRTASQTASTTTTPQTTSLASGTETTPKSDWIEEGMYKVGSDVQPGEYFIQADDEAYYQVSKDSTGSLDSIIANDNFTNTRYQTLSAGQYVELRSCKMIPVAKAPKQQPQEGKYPEGMYKVGRDITAGEYKAVPDGDMSYIEVATTSKNNLNSIAANDNFTAPKYVTIKSGQYVKLVGCYLQK